VHVYVYIESSNMHIILGPLTHRHMQMIVVHLIVRHWQNIVQGEGEGIDKIINISWMLQNDKEKRTSDGCIKFNQIQCFLRITQDT